MGGDYSRDSFDALRDFAGILSQQGRAVLDADWNEMVAIFERRIRAECVDTIGRAVVPLETPNGFRIRINGQGEAEIGAGVFYLDGMRLQNHGLADFAAEGLQGVDPPVFDRARRDDDGGPVPEGVLDEVIAAASGDFLPYDAQPYWPTPDPLPAEDTDGDGILDSGPHLAYVVAWQREVTPVKMPALLEPAMAGIDTCTRLQTVWQVRFVADVGVGTTCATPDEDIEGWLDFTAPSTARLTTDTIDIEDPEDPCLVPPTEDYAGVENQLYRVELGFVGEGEDATQGDARFKFSRENASVVAAVESIGTPADRVIVSRIGRDAILAFEPGDWAEITDDHRELNHRSGRMLRIAEVHPETREIVFEAEIDAGGNEDLIPSGVNGDTLAARHTRLIRWDQRGQIRLSNGDLLVDLDADDSDGLIPVPADNEPVVLESGITVSFSTADGPGRYRDMDYWNYYARTAGPQLQRLTQAPPDGIQRHYARLAVVTFPDSVLDCRVFWPPSFEGGDEIHHCGCTVCVTVNGHNSGALTIQAAIDQIGPGGGTVCLEAGNYVLTSPVTLSERNAIKITGQGIGTILAYAGTGGAIRISGGFDIQLEHFTLFVVPRIADDVGTPGPTHAVTAMNTALLAYRRLAAVVFSPTPNDRFDVGFAFDGIQLGVKVEECLALAPYALASRSSFGRDESDDPVFVGFAELRVLDNILFGARDAIHFDRVAMNIADAILARNLVIGTTAGVRLNWADLPTGATIIEAGTVQASGTPLSLGATDIRLRDCEITGGRQAGDGIRLVPNIVPDQEQDARITGNTIFNLGGVGIRIAGNHGSLSIRDNIVRDCLEAGVATDANAEVRQLTIADNVLEEIAGVAGDLSAGGIVVAGGAIVEIGGNRVHSVGQGGVDDQLYAGIAAQGVGLLKITDNTLGAIGPDLAEVVAIGILVRPPYGDILVTGNQIVGGNAPQLVAGWAAIEIGTPPTSPPPGGGGGLTPPQGGFLAALPGNLDEELAFIEAGRTLFRVSPTRMAAVAFRRTGQIGVRGNQSQAAIRLSRPLMTVFDGGALSLDFSHNQGFLDSSSGLDAVVRLGARRMTVGSNSILHRTDAPTLLLETGAGGAATPTGNITTSEILLNEAGLPAPFDALNMTA